MANEQALLMFSGGKDSFLSACLLIEHGYEIHLVTFEPGASICAHNAKHGADRLVKKYGSACHFVGVVNIAHIWRPFMAPMMNMTPTEVVSKYGELPISQFNCLTCRSAMYTSCIAKAKQDGIPVIAEGARKDQKFAIEQPPMLDCFRELVESYGLKLTLPVYDQNCDVDLKNRLIARNLVPKVLEPQCLLGVPLSSKLSESIVAAAVAYFRAEILPLAQGLIEKPAEVNPAPTEGWL
jgi:hypothetical protein